MYKGKSVSMGCYFVLSIMLRKLELYPSSFDTRKLFNPLSLLIDPVELGRLVADDIILLEPEADLLLGVLDRVGSMADVSTDIDGVISADGARGRCEGVGGTENSWTNIISR